MNRCVYTSRLGTAAASAPGARRSTNGLPPRKSTAGAGSGRGSLEGLQTRAGLHCCVAERYCAASSVAEM